MAMAVSFGIESYIEGGVVAAVILLNIVVGSVIAYVGATARVRREARFRRERREQELETLRLRVLDEEHRRVFAELQEALVSSSRSLTSWIFIGLGRASGRNATYGDDWLTSSVPRRMGTDISARNALCDICGLRVTSPGRIIRETVSLRVRKRSSINNLCVLSRPAGCLGLPFFCTLAPLI